MSTSEASFQQIADSDKGCPLNYHMTFDENTKTKPNTKKYAETFASWLKTQWN